MTELGYGIPRGCAWCQLEVDEVGVSLRNATAKVAKVTRTSGGEAQAGRQGSGKDADPWAGDAPGGYSDEPPS